MTDKLSHQWVEWELFAIPCCKVVWSKAYIHFSTERIHSNPSSQSCSSQPCVTHLGAKSMRLVVGVGYVAVSILAFDLGQSTSAISIYGQGYFLWGYRLSRQALSATFIQQLLEHRSRRMLFFWHQITFNLVSLTAHGNAVAKLFLILLPSSSDSCAVGKGGMCRRQC